MSVHVLRSYTRLKSLNNRIVTREKCVLLQMDNCLKLYLCHTSTVRGVLTLIHVSLQCDTSFYGLYGLMVFLECCLTGFGQMQISF